MEFVGSPRPNSCGARRPAVIPLTLAPPAGLAALGSLLALEIVGTPKTAPEVVLGAPEPSALDRLTKKQIPGFSQIENETEYSEVLCSLISRAQGDLASSPIRPPSLSNTWTSLHQSCAHSCHDTPPIAFVCHISTLISSFRYRTPTHLKPDVPAPQYSPPNSPLTPPQTSQ